MSQQVYLTTIKENPKLQALEQKMSTEKENLSREMDILKAKAINEIEKHKQSNQQIWAEFIDELKAKGLLPSEYADETHSLAVNRKTGQVFMNTKETSGHAELGKVLKELFN